MRNLPALRDNKDNKIESWDLQDEGIDAECPGAGQYISVTAVLNKLVLSGNIKDEGAVRWRSAQG